MTGVVVKDVPKAGRWPGHCSARVRRHVNSLYPQYSQCERKTKPGCTRCWQHKEEPMQEQIKDVAP